MSVFKNLTNHKVARELKAFLGQEDRETRQDDIPPRAAAAIEESRRKLRAAISEVSAGGDLTFVHSYGNKGDDLIYAGVRQLLKGMQYKEISARKKLREASGHTAIMSGGGDWCHAFHSFSPKVFAELEKRFENVILLPTTFDPSVPLVRYVLKRTKALIFAREHASYRRIKDLCNADIAYDTAFFFDYTPYKQQGEGLLNAYRMDPETARVEGTDAMLPPDNNDISMTCESLDEWLWTISRHEAIHTDRAHVMIAGVMMGKRVEYRASNYFKVPAIADYSLSEFPIHRQEDWGAA